MSHFSHSSASSPRSHSSSTRSSHSPQVSAPTVYLRPPSPVQDSHARTIDTPSGNLIRPRAPSITPPRSIILSNRYASRAVGSPDPDYNRGRSRTRPNQDPNFHLYSANVTRESISKSTSNLNNSNLNSDSVNSTWDNIYKQQDKEILELRNALEDADLKAAELEQDVIETRQEMSGLKEENGVLSNQIKILQVDILNALDVFQENLIEERKMREIREKELSDAMQRVLELEQQFTSMYTAFASQVQRRGRHSHYSSGGIAFTIAGDPLCNRERHAQVTQSAWDAWSAQNTRYAHFSPDNSANANTSTNVHGAIHGQSNVYALRSTNFNASNNQSGRNMLSGLGVPRPSTSSGAPAGTHSVRRSSA